MGDRKKLDLTPVDETTDTKTTSLDLEPIEEKKNGNSESTSTSNSVNGTSESTDALLASEIPSIGKIKQQNVQNTNFDNAAIIKDRIAKTFPTMGTVGRESFINTLADKYGYDKSAIQKYVSSLDLPDTRTEQEKKFDTIEASKSPEE